MLPTIEVDDHFAADPIVEDQSGKFSLPMAPIEIRLSGATEGSKVVATQGGELAFEVGVAGGILSIRLAQTTARSITWRSLATEMTFVCFMTVESSRSSPMAELFVEPVAATRTSTPITGNLIVRFNAGAGKGCETLLCCREMSY